MSKAPVPHRRAGIPVASTPRPKPQFTIEEWEAKAPLSDLALKSVAVVKSASEKTPLPLKISVNEDESSRPSTPNLRGKVGSVSRPSTPVPASTRQFASHALHPKQPVQTPQQFYDWFAQIDKSVAHSQEAHFRAHVGVVSEHLNTADTLIKRIDEVDREVSGLLEGWRSVEEGGKNLKDACERLLEERDRLLELTDEIGARLEYFQELEHAMRMLNHPGESLVLQTDFLYMVERVDICIDYLKAHRYYREAEIYLLRFQQCMTRAMTLIRMFFVGSLRALTADVSRRLSEKDVSSTAQMHLLYTRFRSVTSQLSPLLSELERRAEAHPEDLSALLSECHSAYFAARKGLLVGRLMEEIRGLDPAHTELVELTNAGCTYLKHLCTDEFNLYREFFNSGEDQLYTYLENLCDYLYDDLRPRILHETRLTTLCEVCTVLQALMVLDVAELPEEPTDDGNLIVDFDQPKSKGLGQLHISHLLQMVLQDAQTRLFFKAQSVIQAEIRYYTPKPEDLAYPDKLVAMRKPVSQYEIKEKDSVSQLFQLPSLDKKETWFPTLEKTVWVLSQLHDFVKPAIFEDIAHEAVSFCRQSLVTSSNLVEQRSSTGVLDGQLFLVRHLLILKEVANNLDYTPKDTEPRSDIGGMTDTLASVLNRTTALLPDALFASLGMPRGHDTFSDSRHDIDQDLKRACQEVISFCARLPCEPLREWVDRVQAFNDARISFSPGSQAPLLTEQEWAKHAIAENLHQVFIEACERDLRSFVTKLRLYLEDDRTVSVLVTHIEEAIIDAYLKFRNIVWNMYAGAMKTVVFSQDGLRDYLKSVCN
ncbi:Sec34-like family-domain-containing protein [Suillus fuscotomentosus]|uniref:Conserved oligomeric Golgi complex subunit 3 n=1 Tax=Suillus fuscotomentosus TaxID=1912939 RepID=A0AAD4E6B9_9AGAM|nr:Sec34-like family-domain-containing protein [Suillus fuscotomentosus]KAG1900550.1 Sec34-like family-domain-containing protein [Suillus fuscotomentosus]